MGTLRIEPGAFGWEARTLPLCYAAPNSNIIIIDTYYLPSAITIGFEYKQDNNFLNSSAKFLRKHRTVSESDTNGNI